MVESTNKGWNLTHHYTALPDLFYTVTKPTKVKAPKVVKYNEKLAAALGLKTDFPLGEEDAAIFSGNSIPSGAVPLAQAYAGHQFGHFTMLGDGRAILLGEQQTPDDKQFDIQLKGAGKTFYSRGGDGRAALGPMLREYIISEAMHGLGIPTTRSLAVTTTGEDIFRERKLSGAILTRIAKSHIRVGTFQFAATYGTKDELKALADYTIKQQFPVEVESADNPYKHLLRHVIRRQAKLIAKWQLVGFIHGVMNTDNMTISGETIDYGPCAFMDTYDPKTVFSSIDEQGRYAYQNQPGIAGWNLARFAETLLPLLHVKEEEAVAIAEQELNTYSEVFHTKWLQGMRAKLGLFHEQQGDTDLIHELLQLMEKYQADYTNTFLALTFDRLDENLFSQTEFKEWHARWEKRLTEQSESIDKVKERMQAHNPAVIPRNHRVEEALRAAEDHGDFQVTDQLLQVLSNPYAHTKEQAIYAKEKIPHGAYRTFCGT